MGIKKQKRNTKRGLLLLDVLVAISVFTIGFITLSVLVLQTAESNRFNGEYYRAVLYAQEGVVALRDMALNDFDELSTGTYGLVLEGGSWVLASTSDSFDIFMRTITINESDADVKEVVSRVVWDTNASRSSEVVFTEQISDWEQTHGDSAFLIVDPTSAIMASSTTILEGVTIDNGGQDDITIDHVELAWMGSSTVYDITINTTHVFSVTPANGAVSGEKIDIVDYIVATNTGAIVIDGVSFSEATSGTDVMLTLFLSDGSNHHTLIDL